MRSRPDLKLYLFPGTVEAGTRFRAEAELVSRSKTPIDGVEFHLVGTERRQTGTSMVGGASVPTYQEIRHVDLVARTPATTLEEGQHRVAAEFDLPQRCPPTYKSSVTTISYDLAVRVAIPWWPDRSERYIVNVVAPPSKMTGVPGSYCSDGAGPQGKALYLEASLDSTVIDHDGAVRGAVSVANVEHHRVRRLEIALAVNERPNDRSGLYESQRYVLTLHESRSAFQASPIASRCADASSRRCGPSSTRRALARCCSSKRPQSATTERRSCPRARRSQWKISTPSSDARSRQRARSRRA
jgi:hypothetical protein